MPRPPILLGLLGPTASGKTEVAEWAHDRFGFRLINADAFQVYRGFDIGTGKSARPELYSLIDIADPEEQFGLGAFISQILPLLEHVYIRGESAVVVGGTGLYIRALFEEYADLGALPPPELRARLLEREANEGRESLVEELSHRAPLVAAETDLQNPVRVRRALERLDTPKGEPFRLPPFRKAKLALDPPDWRERIALRTQSLFATGWIDEVAELVRKGVSIDAPAFRAIGYRAIAEWIETRSSTASESDDETGRSEALAKGLSALLEPVTLETTRYAKRQRTWLRSEPNLQIVNDPDEAKAFLSDLCGPRLSSP